MKQSMRAIIPPVAVALLLGVSTQSFAQTDQQSTDLNIAPTEPDGVNNRFIGKDPVASVVTGKNEISMANAIEIECPALAAHEQILPDKGKDLTQRCSEIVGASIEGGKTGGGKITSALRELNIDEAAAQGRGLVEFSSIRAVAVAARLQKLRLADAGTTGETVALSNDSGRLNYNFETGGGAGDDGFGRWTVYANGALSTGSRDTTALESGYDMNGGRATFGTDYRLNDNAFLGASVDYITNSADFTNGSKLDTDGFDGTLYGTMYSDSGLYFQGTIGAGSNNYKSHRSIVYSVGGTNVNQTAVGDPGGDQFFWSAGLGKDINAGNGISGNVSATVDYLDANIDKFTEQISGTGPGFGMNLTVFKQNVKSLRSTVGAQLSKAISTQSGVLSPFIQFDWIHEFNNDSRTILARFASDSITTNQAFQLTTDSPDADYFRLGGGLSAVLPRGLQAFVSVETVLGVDHLTYYGVTAGISKEL
ncbi:MAG: autotransporter outer membrane beta-barrel domain-containing protein [Arenicellales bacterium]